MKLKSFNNLGQCSVRTDYKNKFISEGSGHALRDPFNTRMKCVIPRSILTISTTHRSPHKWVHFNLTSCHSPKKLQSVDITKLFCISIRLHNKFLCQLHTYAVIRYVVAMKLCCHRCSTVISLDEINGIFSFGVVSKSNNLHKFLKFPYK